MPRLDRETEVRKAIAAAVIPGGKRDVLVFDEGPKAIPGFGLRVHKTGHVAFILKYTVGRGRHAVTRRVSLGGLEGDNLGRQLARIREMAGEIRDKGRVLGIDVIGEQQAKAAAEANTVLLGSLVPLYLKARASELRISSHTEITRYLEVTWRPLHNRPTDAITRRDIVAIIDGMDAKVAADRARVALSGLYAWLVERGHAETNPCIGIASRGRNGGRTRTLSEAELVAVWKACDDLPGDYPAIVKLLILTGQRKTEIGDLRHSEIDLAKRQIELGPARTKNKRPHIVPLCDQAMAIIGYRAVSDGGSDFLFGRGGGFKGWALSKQQLANAKSTSHMAPWVIHDIRRSVVTGMNELGVQPHVVEAVVNHVSGSKSGVAGIYNKATYLAERRQALDLWGAHIEALVSGGTGKVVSLRRA